MHGGILKTTEYTSMKAIFTRKRVIMAPLVVPNLPDAGLGVNRCQPQVAGEDFRGYALLDRDPYFDTNAIQKALLPRYPKAYPGTGNKRWGLDLDRSPMKLWSWV